MSRPQRVALGPGGVWLGILVTHVMFCVLLSVAVGSAGLISFAFLFGAIPAVIIGWVTAEILGSALKPVANQWLHVLAFGSWGVILGVPFGSFSNPPTHVAAVCMGTAAAVGRFAVWKLARIHDDGGCPAREPEGERTRRSPLSRPPAVVHPVREN